MCEELKYEDEDCIDCANCGEHVTPGFPTYGTNRDICAECWF